MMLPHSIATISIVTAVLPQLSKFVIDGNLEEVQRSIRTSLRLVAIITVPAALFFMTFGELVSQSLFFGIEAESAKYLGEVLSAFALGLIPLSINLVGIRALNAFENTRSQFLTTLLNNLISVGLSILAFFLLDPADVVIALAWSFTISYWLSVLITDLLLKRFTKKALLISELAFYLRVAAVAAVAVGLAWLGDNSLELSGNISRLGLVLVAASLLYLGLARLVKLREVGETIKVILRR
jgi:putative peptidoglycan lipid II flippase